MIAAVVIDKIRDLLAEGEDSRRKIAQQMGVSRGTVNTIAQGKRPDITCKRVSVDPDPAPFSGLPTRCPGCGGMVQMPCLLCHVRSL